MEDAGQIIGYVIALLVFLAPRLLKWFGNNRRPNVTHQRRPARAVPMEDPPVSPAEVMPLMKRSLELMARSEELARLCSVHQRATSALSSPIADITRTPITTLYRALEAFAGGRARLSRSRMHDLEAHLLRQTRLVSLLERLLDQRIRPASAQLLSTLDILAQACLSPWIECAKRRGLTYPSRHAVVILGEPGLDAADLLSEAALAPVILPVAKAETIEGLLSIPHGISLDLLHSVPGLLRRLERFAPGPEPLLHLDAEFDAQTFTSVLAADSICAMAIGPAYCAGLSTLLEATAEPSGRDIPAGLRLYAACLAVELASFATEGRTRFDRVMSRAETPELPSSLMPYTDALVRETVAVIAASTGIAAGGELRPLIHERALAVCESLDTAQIAPRDATPLELLGGALLAFERKATNEARIVHAVLSALAPSSTPYEEPRSPSVPAPAAPFDPRRYLTDRKMVARAVTVGAALGKPRAMRSYLFREAR